MCLRDALCLSCSSGHVAETLVSAWVLVVHTTYGGAGQVWVGDAEEGLKMGLSIGGAQTAGERSGITEDTDRLA